MKKNELSLSLEQQKLNSDRKRKSEILHMAFNHDPVADVINPLKFVFGFSYYGETTQENVKFLVYGLSDEEIIELQKRHPTAEIEKSPTDLTHITDTVLEINKHDILMPIYYYYQLVNTLGHFIRKNPRNNRLGDYLCMVLSVLLNKQVNLLSAFVSDPKSNLEDYYLK